MNVSPTLCRHHRWQDRSKQLCLPLFPCYVSYGADGLPTPSISTPEYLHREMGRPPATVPDGQIEGIRQMVESTFRSSPFPIDVGDRGGSVGTLQGLEGFSFEKRIN